MKINLQEIIPVFIFGFLAHFAAVSHGLDGTKFVLGFLENHLKDKYPIARLYITSSGLNETQVTISVPRMRRSNLWWIQQTYNDVSFNVTPGSVYIHEFPYDIHMLGNGIDEKGILIKSSDSITIHAQSVGPTTSDGYLALPITALGNHYYVASHVFDQILHQDNSGSPSEFGIIATKDLTVIVIELTSIVIHVEYPGFGATKDGRRIQLLLDAFQIYQLQSSDDLSGTRITSNHPIAVLSGAMWTSSSKQHPGDHFIEMLPPVRYWGLEYFAMPIGTSSLGDIFKVIAYDDDTNVEIITLANIPWAGNLVINSGEFDQFRLPTGSLAYVRSTKPVLLVQFAQRGSSNGATTNQNTLMTIVPSVSQWSDHYAVVEFLSFTVAEKDLSNLLSIIIPTTGIPQMQINKGIPMNLKYEHDWQSIPRTMYSYMTTEILNSTFDISNYYGVPFYAVAYGSHNQLSYAFPLGVVRSPQKYFPPTTTTTPKTFVTTVQTGVQTKTESTSKHDNWEGIANIQTKDDSILSTPATVSISADIYSNVEYTGIYDNTSHGSVHATTLTGLHNNTNNNYTVNTNKEGSAQFEQTTKPLPLFKTNNKESSTSIKYNTGNITTLQLSTEAAHLTNAYIHPSDIYKNNVTTSSAKNEHVSKVPSSTKNEHVSKVPSHNDNDFSTTILSNVDSNTTNSVPSYSKSFQDQGKITPDESYKATSSNINLGSIFTNTGEAMRGSNKMFTSIPLLADENSSGILDDSILTSLVPDISSEAVITGKDKYAVTDHEGTNSERDDPIITKVDQYGGYPTTFTNAPEDTFPTSLTTSLFGVVSESNVVGSGELVVETNRGATTFMSGDEDFILHTKESLTKKNSIVTTKLTSTKPDQVPIMTTIDGNGDSGLTFTVYSTESYIDSDKFITDEQTFKKASNSDQFVKDVTNEIITTSKQTLFSGDLNTIYTTYSDNETFLEDTKLIIPHTFPMVNDVTEEIFPDEMNTHVYSTTERLVATRISNLSRFSTASIKDGNFDPVSTGDIKYDTTLTNRGQQVATSTIETASRKYIPDETITSTINGRTATNYDATMLDSTVLYSSSDLNSTAGNVMSTVRNVSTSNVDFISKNSLLTMQTTDHEYFETTNSNFNSRLSANTEEINKDNSKFLILVLTLTIPVGVTILCCCFCACCGSFCSLCRGLKTRVLRKIRGNNSRVIAVKPCDGSSIIKKVPSNLLYIDPMVLKHYYSATYKALYGNTKLNDVIDSNYKLRDTGGKIDSKKVCTYSSYKVSSSVSSPSHVDKVALPNSRNNFNVHVPDSVRQESMSESASTAKLSKVSVHMKRKRRRRHLLRDKSHIRTNASISHEKESKLPNPMYSSSNDLDTTYSDTFTTSSYPNSRVSSAKRLLSKSISSSTVHPSETHNQINPTMITSANSRIPLFNGHRKRPPSSSSSSSSRATSVKNLILKSSSSVYPIDDQELNKTSSIAFIEKKSADSTSKPDKIQPNESSDADYKLYDKGSKKSLIKRLNLPFSSTPIRSFDEPRNIANQIYMPEAIDDNIDIIRGNLSDRKSVISSASGLLNSSSVPFNLVKCKMVDEQSHKRAVSKEKQKSSAFKKAQRYFSGN